MEFEPWQIWTILAILLFIIEIFTATFLTASLALGCLAGGVVSYIGLDINYQLAVFSIGSIAVFFGARGFMKKYAYRHGGNIRTNVSAIVGQIGRVHEIIDPGTGSGRVMVSGDDWKAESLNNQIIESGEKVRIIKVESATLVVEPI